jgi:Ca-activated chloride channel family protein
MLGESWRQNSCHQTLVKGYGPELILSAHLRLRSAPGVFKEVFMKKILYVLTAAFIFVGAGAFAAKADTIKVSASLDRPYVLAGEDQDVVLKVGLIPEQGSTVERLPINIAIVLDKSGSMGSDQKMEKAKQGVFEIVQRLNEGDVISVIVYDNCPRVLIPAQVLKDKAQIINLVSQIYPSGSTALYGGVELGAEELRKHANDYPLNKIILLSDGLANVGPQSTGELIDLGRVLSDEDIIVSTIGVGLDYNEDLMTALAQESGGNSYFAKDSYELVKIFTEEINEAMTIVAKNIKIYVDAESDVEPLDIIGRRGEVKDKYFESQINALYGKNEKYALFEMRAPKGSHGATKALACVRVEYINPATGKVVKTSQKISVQYHRDADFILQKENKDILKEAALTRTSEIKNRAIKLADEGKYDAAANYLSSQSATLEKVASQCNNDKDIVKEAKRCEWLSGNIFSNKGFSRVLRKSVVSESYSQTNQQYYDPGKERKQ